MNIYDSQPVEDEKVKSKKMMIILGIAMAVLFVLILCIIFYISYIEKNTLKLYIDNSKISLKSDMVLVNNGDVFISIDDIAEKIGYEKNNGEYKSHYVEDASKRYLENKYETVSYITDSDEIYKAILPASQNEEIEYEYFKIDKPVFKSNDKMYISIDGLCKGCNLGYSYTKENNTIKIYTLDYFCSLYATKMPESVELSERDDVETYKNRKALLYDMVVVKNSTGKYGVKDPSGNAIIGEKYKSMAFVEGEEEFIVETDEGKFGIIDKKGTIKFEPDYASIKEIDKTRGLYLVSKKSSTSRIQYGIVNRSERTIVYIEYEQIGIDKNEFPANNIENQYILFGKCIPVKRSNKWGLLDLNGNTILPLEFDSFGCKTSSSKNNQANALIVLPDYESIVVCKNGLYGLYNSSGKQLIQELVTDMYVINTSGTDQYYLTYQGETMNIRDYLRNVFGIEPTDQNSNSSNQNNAEDATNTEKSTSGQNESSSNNNVNVN